MSLGRLTIQDLVIDDEASFRHVAIYAELKERLRKDEVEFALPPANSALARDGQVLLLNLAFWKPGNIAEVLVDDHLTADQLVHNGWHHVAQQQLAAAARSADGLLLAEAIASASDAYLVGRLLGHSPESAFLQTQVPAMADAAHDAGLDEAGFEQLLQRMSAAPEQSFEALRALLYDVSRALVGCSDADAAAKVLLGVADHPFAPLLLHYELPGWVLFTKAYADADAPKEEAARVDGALREAEDAMAWLEDNWLG